MVVVTMAVMSVHISFSLHVLDDPLVVLFSLSISKILMGGDHVNIKFWCEVIHGVLGWVMMLSFP